MAKGFFFGSTLSQSKAPQPTVPYCGACGLAKRCVSPKIKPQGAGSRRILIVGESPSRKDDAQGKLFVGDTGQFLRRKLRKLGVDLQTDCHVTNAVICKTNEINGPSPDQISHCQPNLVRTIEKYKPELIILLGGAAVQSLLKSYWKEDVGSINRWAGFRIPFQKLNTWLCPMFHPSFVMQEMAAKHSSVAELLFDAHLEKAIALEGRPWDEVPDYESEVECIFDPDKAARIIRKMVERGGPAAWDYETNMLKPDSTDAKIISCSICWRGKKTIAYPWKGEAIKATQEFIRSPMPKIASNLKFEERWTRAEFGHGARNWWFDTMIGAHVCDNRQEITSIKFQSMVWLGSDTWNDHIEKYLRSGGSQEANQILREIEPGDLLKYNGIDSLLEYHVALKQMEYLNYE